MALWAAAEIDEDLDLGLTIGQYNQEGQYDEGEHKAHWLSFF